MAEGVHFPAAIWKICSKWRQAEDIENFYSHKACQVFVESHK
jgi:hypothetical protein